MAKQVGPLFITGTIDGIIFYKLGEKYYLRSKGAYKSGKQMRKDPYYRRTIEKADQFGLASKLVRWVYYRHLPRAVRKHGLFGKLTGMVNRWLQEGKSKEEVQEMLIAHCTSLLPVKPPQSAAIDKTTIPKTQSATNEQQSTCTSQPKQARYLSRWKVRPNGHLQLPKSYIKPYKPIVTLFSCNPHLNAIPADAPIIDVGCRQTFLSSLRLYAEEEAYSVGLRNGS